MNKMMQQSKVIVLQFSADAKDLPFSIAEDEMLRIL